MAISLKRMQAGDEPAFGRLAPEVFDDAIDPLRLAAYLGTPGHLMILAFEGDLVVGQCAGVIHHHPDKPTELYVDELGTASTHRRQGIGRRLLDAMFDWGRELGCAEAWLGTELDNDAANALYRRVPPVEDDAMQFYVFRL